MNFMFDIINDISGYTSKYYNESVEQMSHNDLVQKYRKEYKLYEGKDFKES